MKKPELLAPAGNLEKLKIAVLYGADAIFLGGQEFGLRSGSDNFSIEEIEEGVKFAADHDVKIYVTTNIYAHSENFKNFKEFVQELERVGVTGIIVGDPGYIKIAQEYAPKLEIHISTQQSITNSKAVKFYENQGYERVVLARELTFEEIEEIVNDTNIEIEVFIHGAVCSSYSGRCTLSNHMTSRDSNRGGCCQSCRWEYDLCYQEGNEYINVALNQDDVPFTMSAKDMSLLEYIPRLCEIGVDSLKVEGRMKSHHYVATVIGVYRKAIDAYFNDPANYKVKQEWIDELDKCAAREVYVGALMDDFSEKGQIYKEQYNMNKGIDYCGYIKSYDPKTKLAEVEQRNYFKVGDTLELFGPHVDNYKFKVNKIYDKDMNEIEKANHPLMKIYLEIDSDVKEHFMLRNLK